MFTGFASENTPAIQVWDFSRPVTGNTTAIRTVSLTDDCAPIQVFKTGGTNVTNIYVYLPSCPPEGKQITIINARYSSFGQIIRLYSSDVNGSGTNSELYSLGASANITLVYSKDFISFGDNGGLWATGWMPTTQGSTGSPNYNSVVIAGASNNAGGVRAIVAGGSTNTASGINSSVLGGLNNSAGASHTSVVGGSGNSALSTASIVLGGATNSTGSSNAAVVGGQNNGANGTNSVIAGGSFSSVSGSSAAVFAGDTNTSSSNCAVVLGGAYGSTRSIIGSFVTPASITPVSGAGGAQQLATLLLGRETTNATATRLASNNSAGGTTNQVILPNNSAYTFQGTVIAARTAAGDTSSWKFEGAIKRGASAASTTLVAAVTPTVIAQDVGAVTWVLAITADTTNGGIAVTVTGAAATTIRWVCKIETTEVTF
jgi:hypothetical protein